MSNHDVAIGILIETDDEARIGLKGRQAEIQFARLAEAFNEQKRELAEARANHRRCAEAAIKIHAEAVAERDEARALCRDLYAYAESRTPAGFSTCPYTEFGKLRTRLRAMECE